MTSPHISLPELLTDAQKQLNQSIPMVAFYKILAALGLENEEKYTPSQVKVFISACTLVIKEGVKLDELRRTMGNKAIVEQMEVSVEKKLFNLTAALGTDMAILEQQMVAKVPLVMQQTLEQWLNTGLVEAIARQARSRILEAEASGKPLDKDFADWCAAMSILLPKLENQTLHGQNQSKSDP